MPTLIETFDPSQILQPVQYPQDERTNALKIAPNLTIARGQALSIKTIDSLGYPLVPGAADGTQLFVGFAKMACTTDVNSNVYFVTSPLTAAPNARLGPNSTLPVSESGTFDPLDLQTIATPIAAVVTITPTGVVTLGDVHTITVTFADLTTQTFTFTVGATATVAAVANGLRAAWNANADMVRIGLASGGATALVLTGNGQGLNVTPGLSFSIVDVVAGTGTVTNVATTAATGRNIADIIPGAPGARVLSNGFWRIP